MSLQDSCSNKAHTLHLVVVLHSGAQSHAGSQRVLSPSHPQPSPFCLDCPPLPPAGSRAERALPGPSRPAPDQRGLCLRDPGMQRPLSSAVPLREPAGRLQHPKGDLTSVYFAGKPRCSRTPGSHRPKGSSCKCSPRQRAGSSELCPSPQGL